MGAAGLGAAAVVAAFLAGRAEPRAAPHEPEVKATPGIITAVRDMARLETTAYHIEKVVEATDRQARLWGLVEAKDDLLIVAVGDVVAGIDLSKLRDEDVVLDAKTRAVRVTLPRPEVLTSTLDEQATHVFARHTDSLARRNEQLEGDARKLAEQQMRAQAIQGGILDRAQESADRTLRSLLGSLGCTKVDLDWQDRG